MEILRITANFPGKGDVDVLESPDLAGIKKRLDVDDDGDGSLGYSLGASFLAPYPNRVHGKLAADGKTLAAEWEERTIQLPANSNDSHPGAERYAMPGLLFKSKIEDLTIEEVKGGQEVSGVLRVGDFGGHWPSKTQFIVTVRLTAEAVDASIEARNVGTEDEPMALGWHPCFHLPSGDRAQVRVRIPAADIAPISNDENGLPTGKFLSVAGTRYDLRDSGGTPLGNSDFDDNWNHLVWTGKAITAQLIDPAARYGLEVAGLSPEIKTIQMVAPSGKNYVAIEHLYSLDDPFGKEWPFRTETGIVTLKPGQATSWHVRLRVFLP